MELLQGGQPPQGWREGHQPRVADGGDVQTEVLEPRHGAPAQGGGEGRGTFVAHMHATDTKPGHGRQRTHAQPLRQPLHAVELFGEEHHGERWQHRTQRAQRRQVGCGPHLFEAYYPRLAQLLAAPHPQLGAQRQGRLMTSPQLLQQRVRRLTQLVADAVEGHGDARIEHVAQLAEDDALLVTAQLRERHRGAAAARGGVVLCGRNQHDCGFSRTTEPNPNVNRVGTTCNARSFAKH
eukprot:scaffold61782_cov78-Phaeocystis_antarctica.AAC.3